MLLHNVGPQVKLQLRLERAVRTLKLSFLITQKLHVTVQILFVLEALGADAATVTASGPHERKELPEVSSCDTQDAEFIEEQGVVCI